MTDTIDPEKLAATIRLYREAYPRSDDMKIVLDAAEIGLATLPRFKEVEVGSWVVVDAQGQVGAFLYHTEADARDAAHERGHGSQVVRLTGTAKVKVTP